MAKGSRGGTRGGATGGLSEADILGTESLVSAREGRQREVDDVLTVARDLQSMYGDQAIANDLQVATLKKGNVLAYFDSDGNVAVNAKFLDTAKMNESYDKCVKNGYHPSRGNKSGIEAVTAHEFGHKMTESAGAKMNLKGFSNLDRAADKIVLEARGQSGHKNVSTMRKKISGYASQNNAECIAEAFADVYCNGNKAKRESKAVVNVLNKYLKGD